MQRIVKSCLYKGWFCNRRGTRKIIISPDPSLYNGLFNLLPNLSQILFHSFRIFVLDNFEKILQSVRILATCPGVRGLNRIS
jgi:hypothetical protein